jgi:hypothetical protein
MPDMPGRPISNGVTSGVRPLFEEAYQIQVHASGVDLSGLANPVTVRLSIGNNADTPRR